MKKSLSIILLMLLSGGVSAEINTGIGHPIKGGSSAPPPPSAPKNHEMFSPPAAATAQGKVLQSIDGAGYTYLELEAGGKQFWIAGTQVEAKKGDTVSYDENVVMENFFSKTLNRSFDRIVFASHVKVVK